MISILNFLPLQRSSYSPQVLTPHSKNLVFDPEEGRKRELLDSVPVQSLFNLDFALMSNVNQHSGPL